jgi:hypothetical protein
MFLIGKETQNQLFSRHLAAERLISNYGLVANRKRVNDHIIRYFYSAT